MAFRFIRLFEFDHKKGVSYGDEIEICKVSATKKQLELFRLLIAHEGTCCSLVHYQVDEIIIEIPFI